MVSGISSPCWSLPVRESALERCWYPGFPLRRSGDPAGTWTTLRGAVADAHGLITHGAELPASGDAVDFFRLAPAQLVLPTPKTTAP